MDFLISVNRLCAGLLADGALDNEEGQKGQADTDCEADPCVLQEACDDVANEGDCRNGGRSAARQKRAEP